MSTKSIKIPKKKPSEEWPFYIARVLELNRITREEYGLFFNFLPYGEYNSAVLHCEIGNLGFGYEVESEIIEKDCESLPKSIEDVISINQRIVFYDEGRLEYSLKKDKAVVSELSELNAPLKKEFSEFLDPNVEYNAQELVNKMLTYFLSNYQPEVKEDKSIEEKEEQTIIITKQPLDSPLLKEISWKIDTIQRSVKKLENIAATHPVVMQGEDVYLKELYVRAINENLNNLQILEYDGQKIPYVLVDSFDLEGKPGKPFKNLYFVARDKATEEWQQKIVAYHESLCVKIGHDNAKAKELALAKFLGKEKEYYSWRERIDNGF